MPIIEIKAVAAIVILATMTGREIQSPIPTQTSALQTSAKQSEVIIQDNRQKTPKLTRNRPQKPARTKLKQYR